jgi:AraC family transcriptional regulator of adaptative response/methylated-DNA-[protein]-cysteine methyltransferase
MNKPAPTLDNDSAWEAVLQRDRDWDGRLFYGVTSTGVACRPSCPSRRPRRDRVRFYATLADALAAGFRPCRRCHPEQLTLSPAATLAVRVKAYLDQHADAVVSLQTLAGAVGVSPWHLQRTFVREVGMSPREYAVSRRAARLRDDLRREPSVSRATYSAGFGSSSRLYEHATELLGMTPGAYRRGGQGMEIRYTVVDSPLGRLLVAVTDRGVCAVTLGESDRALERALRQQFPAASVERVDAGDDWLSGLVAEVGARIERPGANGPQTPPLDLQGTAFQYRVWQALLAIPVGETRTYQQLARAVGKPRAIRAVANACAANRVAVVVPCHRVIRSDGSLGGYRWGLPRKEKLLAEEKPKASAG